MGKAIKTLVIIISAWVSLSVGVLATSVYPFVTLDSTAGVSSTVDNINGAVRDLAGEKFLVEEGFRFVWYEDTNNQVFLQRDKFNELNVEYKRKIMKSALKIVSDSSMGARDKQRLYNFIAEQDSNVSRSIKLLSEDMRADITWSSNFVSGFKGFFNTFLGMILMLVSMFLLLQIAIDLFAMNSPVVMYWALNKYKDNRPFFISPEAWYSYKEAVAGDVYKDYLLSYLVRSLPKVIITGLVITYMILGNVMSLTLWLVDFFQG